jgi:hypothetical protein
MLTHEWQEVPAGWAVPPGADIRFDLANEKRYVRQNGTTERSNERFQPDDDQLRDAEENIPDVEQPSVDQSSAPLSDESEAVVLEAHDQEMAEGARHLISKGYFDSARRKAAFIHDAQLRAAVEIEIDKAEGANAVAS